MLAPRHVSEKSKAPRGIIVFDLDGTLVDDMREIGDTAAQVMHEAFGTPLTEAHAMYYASTGMPFERQLLELYPDSSREQIHRVALHFHEIKITDAYSKVHLFPEVPLLLKDLVRAGWTLVVATGAEREMATLVLEREGVAFLFDDVMGAGQGTKDVHVTEYRQRWPGIPFVLVGDSRFDMEIAKRFPGMIIVGRACRLPGWIMTPQDMTKLGAAWADYSLEELPKVLDRLSPREG